MVIEMEYDFYEMYLDEMGRIPALKPEEEAALLEGAVRGEREARERLVEGSLGRALALAREYEDRELPMADLVQEANTALMLATVEYDGSRQWAELLEYRVREAMRLLRETGASISDVAARVGYETQGKFTRAFKDVAQMLPSEYRRRCRSE